MIQINTLLMSIATLPMFLLLLTTNISPATDHKEVEVVKSERLDFVVDTIVTSDDIRIPWGMAFLPNNDILVTDRGGTLHLIQNGELHPKPIGGVPEVRAKGQGGLLDIELHPKYEQNGWIYLTYSKPSDDGKLGTTALSRAKLKDYQLVEVEERKNDPLDYPALSNKWADFVWFTPKFSNEDYCKRL